MERFALTLILQILKICELGESFKNNSFRAKLLILMLLKIRISAWLKKFPQSQSGWFQKFWKWARTENFSPILNLYVKKYIFFIQLT